MILEAFGCAEALGGRMSVALAAGSAIIASFDDDKLVLEFDSPSAMSDGFVSRELAGTAEYLLTLGASRTSCDGGSCGRRHG